MNPIPKELTALLDYSHTLARLLLTEQGEFYPFGAYLSNANTITQRVFPDGDDFPLSTGLINIIKHDFDSQLASGSVAGTAITYAARITNINYSEPVDVVIVRLNSKALKSPILHYFPFQLLDGKFEYLTSWTATEEI